MELRRLVVFPMGRKEKKEVPAKQNFGSYFSTNIRK